MNSYETYKVICGILFGYKFISYYYDNKDKSICKKMGIFATKPIPYILLFFILHFIFNYPIFIYVRNLFGDIRNSYLSSIMGQFTCQKNAFTIITFKFIWEYNSNEFNIGQFNGCSRPILFTFSEFFCFILVLIIGIVNICLCHKKSKVNWVNIGYIFFLLLNFIYLGLTYFVTKEVKDLTGEYILDLILVLSIIIKLMLKRFGIYIFLFVFVMILVS